MEINLLENIEKVPIYKVKVDKIYKNLNETNLKDAYTAVIAMIESALIILLKKVYNEELSTSHLATISKSLAKNNEKLLSEEAIFVNANREDKESVEDLDLEYIIQRLDFILGNILENHGNIFEK